MAKGSAKNEIYSKKYRGLLKTPEFILSVFNDKDEISDTELVKRVSEKAKTSVHKGILKEIIRKQRENDPSYPLYILDAEGGKYYITNDVYTARRRRVENDLPMFLFDPPYSPAANARGATLSEIRKKIQKIGIDIQENELEKIMQKFMDGYKRYAPVKREGELYIPNASHPYFTNR